MHKYIGSEKNRQLRHAQYKRNNTHYEAQASLQTYCTQIDLDLDDFQHEHHMLCTTKFINIHLCVHINIIY